MASVISDIGYVKLLEQSEEGKRLMTLSISEQEKSLIKNIAKEFISENQLLVYGGYALNALLPEKDKFYKDEDFNDFDLLSPSAEVHARALADIMYNKGYIYTEVKGAVHENTYKVFVNFTHVADITNVSEEFYFEMLKLSQSERTKHKYLKATTPLINIAPIGLLKHYLIAELAKPESSFFRWQKVVNRLTLLNKYYTVPNSLTKSSKAALSKYSGQYLAKKSTYTSGFKDILTIFDKVLEVIKVHQYPLIGSLAVGMYLGTNIKNNSGKEFLFECCRLDEFFSVFEILSTNPEQTIHILKSHLKGVIPENYNLVVEERYYSREIISKRYRIYIAETNDSTKKISLLTIIDANEHCYAVVEKSGYVLGTPYTILNFLYAYWLIYKVYESESVSNRIKLLFEAMELYVTSSSPLTERFVTSCYGNSKSQMNVFKENFFNQRYSYKPASQRTNKKAKEKNKTST